MVASKPLPVSVHVRLPDRVSELVVSWLDIDVQTLRTAAPWRTFLSYKGQRHYSGSFWSATENGLVLYESRLELARLLFANFDRSVRGIVAQPFLLETEDRRPAPATRAGLPTAHRLRSNRRAVEARG
ncbi:hypothetical protein SK854_05855 [Lentzea sp. BCCO 10_0061]|uniref:Uncharacterized protein n=1 Tax=Lentzea sokolovensis TaxID=3095429 RepID=A0ABU4UQ53_9PSEU|nr:hypothetical protein [Lentzea sp. BCCO 10_0061]MDX8141627.1 hypothetical protein [Lentzea sp. BCCO 10_0061]